MAARYFLDAPTSWSYDLGQWFLCLSVMLALPEVTRKRGHVAITFLVDRLPPGARRTAGRLLALAAGAACLATAGICLRETLRQFSQGIETLWNHPVPKGWVSAAIPFGFLLCGLHFLREEPGREGPG